MGGGLCPLPTPTPPPFPDPTRPPPILSDRSARAWVKEYIPGIINHINATCNDIFMTKRDYRVHGLSIEELTWSFHKDKNIRRKWRHKTRLISQIIIYICFISPPKLKIYIYTYKMYNNPVITSISWTNYCFIDHFEKWLYVQCTWRCYSYFKMLSYLKPTTYIVLDNMYGGTLAKMEAYTNCSNLVCIVF